MTPEWPPQKMTKNDPFLLWNWKGHNLDTDGPIQLKFGIEAYFDYLYPL